MATQTVAEDYLDAYGKPAEFRANLAMGQRIGQAFFNALSSMDQEYLRGGMTDPFFENDSKSVEAAVERLLDRMVK